MTLNKILKAIDLLTSDEFSQVLSDYKDLKKKYDLLEADFTRLHNIVNQYLFSPGKDLKVENVSDFFKKVL